MASATDFYNELKGANSRLDGVNGRLDDVKSDLDDIKGKLDAVKAATDAVRVAVEHADTTLKWGFTQLITLGQYTNLALFQNNRQNDTIICILEHISKNTCELLNEAHTQTGLENIIKNNSTLLADLYATTHAEAALIREREEALRKQIEQCCPPKPPESPCGYQPCPAPERTSQRPPQVDPHPPQ
jgi:hypothetical protein